MLLGWITDSAILRSLIPGLVAMNPATATSFVVAGVAVLGLGAGAHHSRLRSVARAGALALVLIGLSKGTGLFGLDLGIDQLLFREKLADFVPPNRMAPNTAVTVVFFGVTLWLLSAATPVWRDRAQYVALLAGLIGVFAVLGYIYGVSALYGVASSIPMALNTALGFVLMSVAIIAARPDSGPAAILSSRTPGGALARRLLPAAIGLPAVLGWARIQGERAGLFDSSFGVSWMVLMMIVLFGSVTWRACISLDRGEVERRRSEEERKKLALEVDGERRTLLSVMASMHDGLLVLDSTHRVEFVNARARDLLGVPSVRPVGVELLDEFCSLSTRFVDPERARAAWLDALTLHQSAPSFTLSLSGPPAREVQVNVFPISDQDGKGRIGILLRDVTDERGLARTKDQLVAVVSHELRTPLAALVGFAELLLTREYDIPQRQKFLQTMLTEGKRLTNLINDFLDLQRMGGGMTRLRSQPLALNGVVQQAIANAGSDIQRPILYTIPEDLTLVSADHERLEQILANLIGNARKYSPGGGEIMVSAQQLDGWVEVSVADRGLGIPAEALAHVFDRFYRVDNSDRRAITGTGLGLSIVRELVEAHGGEIRATSPGPRQGSTFTFTLPVAPQAKVPAPSPFVISAAPNSGSSRDVLIVEDDDAFAAWLNEVVERDGYAVRRVTSVEEALGSIKAARPGVVLLDLRLRDRLDGWDLLALLRANADTYDLPVVIVSAEDEQDRGRAMGVDDYFVKPVEKEALLAKLASLAPIEPGMIVLVVDDDTSTRDLALHTLQRAGVQARGACSGEEALAILDEQPAAFGLLVLDLCMPGMDGFGVLDALERRPSLAQLPVVIFTARPLQLGEQQRLLKRSREIVRKGNGVPLNDAVARWLGSPMPSQPDTRQRPASADILQS